MRPLRRDAERNRERIVAAARELFAEQGLDVGVDEIARRAGVGMGTLYRRFPTKDALVEAILETVVERIRLLARDAIATEPPGAALRVFLFQSVTADACKSAFLSSRLWTGRTNAMLFAEVVPLMATMFDDAQAAGTVRPDAHLADLLVLLQSLRVVLDVTEKCAPGAWRRHLEILLDGLRPGGSNSTLEPEPVPLDRLRQAAATPLF
jgi:AcrR family transcriptional regulator